jgi:hypothetical protein
MAAMFEIISKAIVYGLEVYAVLGLAFALLFVWIGVQRLDTEAVGSGLGFRLLILPGVAAFWPLLLSRWTKRVTEPPVEENPHRRLSQRQSSQP